jgi:hypothetical protein
LAMSKQPILEDAMANFIKALNLVLNDMYELPENEDGFCVGVYPDASFHDNAIVMLMEYDHYGTVHAVMKELHARLTDKLGHPPSICHNSPSDETILIHGGPHDARVYYADECCKKQDIEICLNWLKSKSVGYRQYHAIALGAEAYADMCGRSVEYVLNTLNWDEDVQAQLIRLMVEAYNFTKGE